MNIKTKFNIGDKVWVARSTAVKVELTEIIVYVKHSRIFYKSRFALVEEKEVFNTRAEARKYFKENHESQQYQSDLRLKAYFIGSLKKDKVHLANIKKRIKTYELKRRANPTQTIKKGI